MNVPTCYRCPERTRNGSRCPILQQKLDAVRGVGLSSIRFYCQTRLNLFKPGDVVEFQIYSHEHSEDWLSGELVQGSPLDCRGIVMRNKGRKVLVYVDDDDDSTERPIVNLYLDGLHKTGERHPVCIHCGKPEGKDIELTSRISGEIELWQCRSDDESFQVLFCEYATTEAKGGGE